MKAQAPRLLAAAMRGGAYWRKCDHTHTHTHSNTYIYCRLSIYYLFIIGLMPDKLQHTLKSQDQHRVQDQDYKL